MALRDVKPLDNEQWKQVTDQLRSGPTDKSIKTIEDALKLGSKLKEEQSA